MLVVSLFVLGSFSPMIAYATENTPDFDVHPMDTSVADGDLRYYGGQDDDVVFSEISQTYLGQQRGHDYNVKAIEVVAGKKYSSGWLLNYAYVEKDRVWYGNETSYYDYEALF